MKTIQVTAGNESEVKELGRFLFTQLPDKDLRILIVSLLDEVSNYQKVVRVLEEYSPEKEEKEE